MISLKIIAFKVSMVKFSNHISKSAKYTSHDILSRIGQVAGSHLL